MKSTILKAATYAAAAIVLSASPLMAQYKDMKLTIDVPFSFDAGGRMIEAGKFNVRRAAVAGAIVMRDVVTSSFAVVSQTTGNPSAKPYLRFHKYGNTWFLREIQEPGNPVALVLPRSARLKEIERAAGPNAKPLEVATITASSANAAGAAE